VVASSSKDFVVKIYYISVNLFKFGQNRGEIWANLIRFAKN